MEFLLVASSPSHVSNMRLEIDIDKTKEGTKDPLHHQSLFKPESHILKKKNPTNCCKISSHIPYSELLLLLPKTPSYSSPNLQMKHKRKKQVPYRRICDTITTVAVLRVCFLFPSGSSSSSSSSSSYSSLFTSSCFVSSLDRLLGFHWAHTSAHKQSFPTGCASDSNHERASMRFPTRQTPSIDCRTAGR